MSRTEPVAVPRSPNSRSDVLDEYGLPDKTRYHLRTLWLFTKSDMPTSTGTNTTFAIAGIVTGESMVRECKIEQWIDVARGVLVCLYFTWHLTLCFNLGNQRQPDSITEDALNKPWRPIPAGRISPELSRRWQLFSIGSLLLLCITVLQAWPETLFYLFCTFLYNEKGCGNKSWWKRTLLNGCGITTNRAASLRVAAAAAQGFEHEVTFTTKTIGWLLICAMIVCTTIQVQDLRDQEGDAKINRRTLPLIVGDARTRWATTATGFFWSVACPFYWGLGPLGYALPLIAAVAVSGHMLYYRDRHSDHRSFRFVGMWWMFLYFLPIMKKHGL